MANLRRGDPPATGGPGSRGVRKHGICLARRLVPPGAPFPVSMTGRVSWDCRLPTPPVRTLRPAVGPSGGRQPGIDHRRVVIG